jgi:hypothetical protein
MATEPVNLDDARLAKIEAAADAHVPSSWHQNAPATHEVYLIPDDVACSDFAMYDTLALTIKPETAAHIVATQPRVALAMVAEIRRLRKRVEVLERVREAAEESGGSHGHVGTCECMHDIRGCFCGYEGLREALDAAEEAK